MNFSQESPFYKSKLCLVCLLINNSSYSFQLYNIIEEINLYGIKYIVSFRLDKLARLRSLKKLLKVSFLVKRERLCFIHGVFLPVAGYEFFC